MFREVTPVSHISLKTDLTDYRERCWKTIPRRVDPVECYRLFYYRILGNPFQVLAAQEREAYLSRMEGQTSHVVALH